MELGKKLHQSHTQPRAPHFVKKPDYQQLSQLLNSEFIPSQPPDLVELVREVQNFARQQGAYATATDEGQKAFAANCRALKKRLQPHYNCASLMTGEQEHLGEVIQALEAVVGHLETQQSTTHYLP